MIVRLRLVLLMMLPMQVIFCYGQPPGIGWQKLYGDAGIQKATAICNAPGGGYVFTVTSTGNDSDFPANFGETDTWIIKTDAIGNLVWKTHAGGQGTDVIQKIIAVKGGGYAAFGQTSSGDITGKHGTGSTTDFWLVRLDNNGKILWQKCYGGSDFEDGYSIDTTQNSDLVLAGMAVSNDGDVIGHHGNGDFWVIRINNTGDILWQLCAGGINPDQANSIINDFDGGFLVTGFSFSGDGDVSANNRDGNIWLIKVSANGRLLWNRSYGGSSPDYGKQVIGTRDKGYLIGGYSYSPAFGNHGEADYYLIKAKSDGSVSWQYCFGGLQTDILAGIIEESNGDIILAGNSNSVSGNISDHKGSDDFWLLKINSNGSLIWSRSYGGFDDDIGITCIKTPDEGYAVVGQTNSSNGDLAGFTNLNANAWLLKLNCIPLTPVVKLYSKTTNICPGENVRITASVTNIGNAPLYQWMKNNNRVGINDSVYEDASLKQNDIIYCIFTTTTNCGIKKIINSDTIVFNTKLPSTPALSISTFSATVCKGSDVLFLAASTDADSLSTFTWFINNTPIVNNNDSFYTGLLKDGDKVFAQMVSHSPCIISAPVNSNEIVVKVVDTLFSALKITANDSVICPGDAVSFTANASGATGTYAWFVNNISEGVNQSIITIEKLKNNDIIYCLFTRSEGCSYQSASNKIKIQVSDLPLVKCMNDTTVLQGVTLPLHAAVSGNYMDAVWTSSTATIQNPLSVNNATIFASVNSLCILTVNTIEGCSVSDEVFIAVNKRQIIPNAFSPNNDGINDYWQLPVDASCNDCFVNIFDCYGALVFSAKPYAKPWDGKQNGKPLPAGVYYYYIKISANKKAISGSVILLR
jgi:gliding motility-associated-like protein